MIQMNQVLVNFLTWLESFETKKEGQGMVEYALILVLVSIVAIAVLKVVGTSVTAVFQKIADSLAF